MIDGKRLIKDIDNKVAGLTNMQIFKIMDIIEEQPKVYEWIPVSERLPDKDELVLCSLNPDNPTIIHLVIISRFDNSHHWHDGIIKAWMPLPEPYKG